MIEVFKITKHKYDYKVAPELIYNINKVTTGNNYGLSKNRSHYDLRKFSFTTTLSLKKTSPTFVAITRERIVGFS